MNVRVPSLDGAGLATVRRAALEVRLRPPGSAPGQSEHSYRADGQLDAGADVSTAPMWLLQELGVPIDRGTRRKIYGVTGEL